MHRTTSRPATVRARKGLIAALGVFAFFASSCTPPPNTYTFGPVTVPLPPIGAEATPVEYSIDIPGIPPIQLTPEIPSVQLTPEIPSVQLTPYIPPVQLTPYIPPICIPLVGCSPEVPATYSPAIPATYSPAIPATYSPYIPATYSPAIPGGTCSAGFTPPSFFVNGVTATLPLVTVDVGATTATVPDVTIDIPGITLSLGAGSVGCSVLGLPPVNLSTGDVQLIIPAQSTVQNATIDLATGLLTLSNPSVTVTGVGLRFLGLSADFNLPAIAIPLPTITIPLTLLSGNATAAA